MHGKFAYDYYVYLFWTDAQQEERQQLYFTSFFVFATVVYLALSQRFHARQ